MCSENNFENNLSDLSDSLKVVQETIYCIRKKINSRASLLENLSSQEQSLFECFHGMLSSQNLLLQYILQNSENPVEIKKIKHTQDLIHQACGELKVLAGINENEPVKKGELNQSAMKTNIAKTAAVL